MVIRFIKKYTGRQKIKVETISIRSVSRKKLPLRVAVFKSRESPAVHKAR